MKINYREYFLGHYATKTEAEQVEINFRKAHGIGDGSKSAAYQRGGRLGNNYRRLRGDFG